MFFAVVKRVAAAFPGSELAGHYRQVEAGNGPAPALGRAFAEFVQEHWSGIVPLLETRMVQTNEVGRCAYLMPGFALVAAENPGRPLSLIDVGASAGLNLNWEKYRYRYSTGHEFGPPDSPVVIRCEARKGLPRFPTAFPTVSFSVGLDLAPVDLSDDEEYQWMQALIWPEHRDRSARLSAARNVWLRSPPTVLQGDAVDLLPEALRRAPEDSTLCVFHCHTLNQFPTQTRERFESILKEASMHRTVYHMSSEGPRVSLSRIVGGDCSVLYSARRQVHGRWIEWDTHPRVS